MESEQKPQIKLCDVKIENEQTAFHLMIQFLVLAQKRGAFTFEESAKIFECIKTFENASQQQQQLDKTK